jgi:hypothetical protein
MDLEYIIIGIIFLITGISIVVYKFRYHTVKDNEEYSKFNGKLASIILVLILFATHLIWSELEKIIYS